MNIPKKFEGLVETNRDEDFIFRAVNEAACLFQDVGVRVAGGWVRDKLMGRASGSDIDMTVTGMPADEFAKVVAKRLGVGEHMIRENPEKSKHVRTARLNLRTPPVSLDFAMARAERYADDSRIPFVSAGTPEEDALRRDFTVNALFWRVPNGPVEDFCGGMDDLKAKVLRSPIAPEKMFMDDPLRVLRAARFAAKLGFWIETELYRAMGRPEVISALRAKVSKERVGEEIVKMASCPLPNMSFNILREVGVFDALLSDALEGSSVGKLAPLDMSQGVPGRHGLNLWAHSIETAAAVSRMSEGNPELVVAGLFHDFGKAAPGVRVDGDEKSSYIGHERHSADIVGLFMNHVKAGGNGVAERVANLVNLHMRPHFLHTSGSAGMRRFVRRCCEAGVPWRDVLLLSEADFISRGDVDNGPNLFGATTLRIELSEAAVTRDKFGRPKPILDGNEIMDALGIAPGPWMANLVMVLAEWQDTDPDLSKDDAVRRLREGFAEVALNHRRA